MVVVVAVAVVVAVVAAAAVVVVVAVVAAAAVVVVVAVVSLCHLHPRNFPHLNFRSLRIRILCQFFFFHLHCLRCNYYLHCCLRNLIYKKSY